MDFKRVTLADLPILEQMLAEYNGKICDISPGNLVMWRDYYEISYWYDGTGYAIRFGNMDGMTCYYCPSSMTDALLEALGGEGTLTCLCAEEVAYLQERFACGEAIHERDWDDYLYEIAPFLTLGGKRFHGQRNHVN